MTMRSWIRNVFTRPATRPIRKVPQRFRPALEALEHRWLPSTFTVNGTGDSGTGSSLVGDLRYCITHANANAGPDTIVFDPTVFSTPQTITLTGGRLTLTDTATTTITGPAAGVTISGNNTTGVIAINSGDSAALSGLTLTGGSTINGGGLDNDGTATLTNCTVSGNSAGGRGGGIFNDGTATLTNCTVSGNGALYGGGLYNIGDNFTLTDCTVSGNSAVYGGGLENIGGVTLTNCTVSGNSAVAFPSLHSRGGGLLNIGTATLTNCTVSGNSVTSGSGGGLYNYHYSIIILTNCTVSGNSAVGGGGLLSFGTASLTNCTVSGNSAGSGGGLATAGTASLTNCTVSGNSAGSGNGGGLDSYGGNVALTNCTVTGNSAGSGGGGLFNVGFSTSVVLTLTNCTVSGNSASFGGGLVRFSGPVSMGNSIVAGNTATSSGPDAWGTVASRGNNLIGQTDGSSGWVSSDLTGTSATPLDPLLASLGDYGGPTQTMALLAGSPALNAGDPTQLGIADQRGVVRAGGVNIGAYQASASAFVLTAPVTATAGTPFDLTVKAVDPFMQTAVGYTGTVTFTSADPYGATLPADYTFSLADGGVHTFAGGATLYTAGAWDVTATDTVTASITGAATVAVNPAAADHLLFLQQPTDTAAGQTIGPVVVEVVDAFGNVETGDNSDMITLSIGTNPSGGTLSGTLTVTVVNGVAAFSDLSIDLAGAGYTLHATTTGLTDAESGSFRITA
jgi:hypothetical protein